jgi:hypothetical protein
MNNYRRTAKYSKWAEAAALGKETEPSLLKESLLSRKSGEK